MCGANLVLCWLHVTFVTPYHMKTGMLCVSGSQTVDSVQHICIVPVNNYHYKPLQ